MADVHDAATRSRNMAAIRSRDTRPELLIRKALHAAGLRYRLNARDLPGKPDLVFPRHKAVIFVHGCFWHQHGCHLFRWPATREAFWREKIGRNVANDENVARALLEAGWRVATVWECALMGRCRLPLDNVVDSCESWIRSDRLRMEIRGI